MKTFSILASSVRRTLIVVGLVVGAGLGPAQAASGDAPQARSDGLGAAISDTAITAKVKTKLAGNDSLKNSDISVTTTNGVVTLDGTATSAKAKAAAKKESMSVDGVKSVDNNLTTPQGSKTLAKTERVVSDSWITTKVKSEILADNLSKGVDVSVTTLHGVVVLKGTLANQDAVDHVKDIAAKIQGVKSVDTSGLTVAGK